MNFIKRVKGHLNGHKRGLSDRLMRFPRKMYHIRKSRINRNDNPTIICNNCVGGVILHDLGLRFNTPTINTLFLCFEDFLYFVEHLEEFSKLDVHELKQTENVFPVGIQEYNGRIIKIGFVHYASFDEGRAVWMKRMKRANLNNTFIVYESRTIKDKELKAFSSIKYPKLVFSLTDKSREQEYLFIKGIHYIEIGFQVKYLSIKDFLALNAIWTILIILAS
ncbi:DUF1919 domain-containing protein [Prevotella sp. oral taxon 475]|uniref:DUF1919 domain-containing protein n=1 Tax=Prevotella sp. oral taxon 475 TaxID=712471 RepID=UPI002012B781|nr:DUF1919 domain-containing protein [Prevotella sp. oral taxon 475]